MTYRPLIKIRFSELFLEWIRIKYVKIQQLCKLIKICSFKTLFFLKLVARYLWCQTNTVFWGICGSSNLILLIFVFPVHTKPGEGAGGEREQKSCSRMKWCEEETARWVFALIWDSYTVFTHVHGTLLFRVAKISMHSVIHESYLIEEWVEFGDGKEN